MPKRRRKKKIDKKQYIIISNIKVKKPKKKLNEYSSQESYIEAFYRKNKDYIDNNVDPGWVADYGTPKRAFRKLVKDKMKYDKPGLGRKYNAAEAIKAVIGSKDMNPNWSAKDVYANNFIQKIKSDKDLRTAIMNEMDEEKLIKYSYIRQPRKKKENEVVDDLAESLEKQAKIEGKQIDVVKVREGFKKEKVKFEGYFNVFGTNAVVYSYEYIYIIEYKSPKKGTGATFDVMSRWDFEKEEENGMIIFQKYRKRS